MCSAEQKPRWDDLQAVDVQESLRFVHQRWHCSALNILEVVLRIHQVFA